jgi:hypothetical protein
VERTSRELGKNQSETARTEIEDKYGLVKAGSTHKQELHTNLNKAVYGKCETKRTIDNIVGEVIKRYKFSSLTEFNAVLRQNNVIADRGRGGMLMYEKNGLRFSLLDSKGKQGWCAYQSECAVFKANDENTSERFWNKLTFKGIP